MADSNPDEQVVIIPVKEARQERTRLSRRADFNLSPLLMSVLDIIADRYSMSRSDVIRQSMLAGLPIAFPDYNDIYQEEVNNG